MPHRLPPLRIPLMGLAAALVLFLAAPAADAAEHRFGIGLEYWRTVDGLPSSSEIEGIEDDGQSWVVSYQYKPAGLFTFQVDAEFFDDGFAGSTDSAYAPQAFILVGRGLYGGVGAGVTISNGLADDVSDPFYMGRLGFNFSLLGALKVDLHATYRFDDWEGLEDVDVDTDTYTLGATLRVRL